MKEYDIHYGSLSNNVRHLEIVIPNRETAACMIFVKTGSRNELTPEEGGISHALEHKIYRGTNKHTEREWGLMADRMGSNQSAYTEKEFTAYYLNVRNGHVPKSMELLSELLTSPSFPKGLIKLENGVIVGEIEDYKDDPRSTVTEQFEGLLFEKTNMARPILGTKSSVLSQSRRDLINYMDKWYRGGNVLVVLSGKVNRMGKLVEKYFSKLPEGKIQKYEGTSGYGESSSKVVTKNTTEAYFLLGVPGLPMGDERFYTLRVIEAILGGHEVLDDRTIQSSMLYDKLRIENGITYEVSATSFSGSDVGYLGVQGIAQPQDLQQTLDIVKKVMYRLASKVTREQVSMAKNFLSDHIIQQIDTSHGAAEFLGVPALILDKVEKPSEILEKIQAVTLKDVRNLASELLVPEQTRLAVLGPFKEVDGELKRVRNGKIK